MAQIEPMDIDSIGGAFEDKENSLQNSNVLQRIPCTEKGYEELDVSELNMKLRYSITPASSPISRSYTANCKDNKTFNIDEDSLNSTIVNDSTSLTRSLNSTITKLDISKSNKLPLQSLPTDPLCKSLDNDHDITITVNGTYSVDENLSLPSTSSSAAHTPEATTPTKDIPKDGGSPIMRGLKSVLNMFRTSQSPIPPEETTPKNDTLEEEQNSQYVLASTPKVNKHVENTPPKRTSPLKDSVVFNDDLERELQWKDDSTIIFKQEKIPIHKLLLQPSISLALEKKLQNNTDPNSTVEYMDISYNDSVVADKTMTDVSNINTNIIESASGVDSESEFVDCETTYNKIEHFEQHNIILDHKGNRYSSEGLNNISAIQENEQNTEKNENLTQHELVFEQQAINNKGKDCNRELLSDKGNIQIEEKILANETKADEKLTENEPSIVQFSKQEYLNDKSNDFSSEQPNDNIDIQINAQQFAGVSKTSNLAENQTIDELCVKQNLSDKDIDSILEQLNGCDLETNAQLITGISRSYEKSVENVSTVEQCSKPEDLGNSFNAIQNNAQLEKSTELPEILNEINLVKEVVTDINLVSMNASKDLNISKQSDIKNILLHNSLSNDERILNNTQEEDKLSTTLPIGVNEEIDLLEEKPLNVTMQLNILTDYQVNNANESKDSSVVLDNNFKQSENSSNAGILQICTSESENYTDSKSNNGHEHAANPTNFTDIEINSTSVLLEEECKNESVIAENIKVKQAFIEQLPDVTILSSTNDEEKINMSVDEFKVKNAGDSIQHDIHYLNKNDTINTGIEINSTSEIFEAECKNENVIVENIVVEQASNAQPQDVAILSSTNDEEKINKSVDEFKVKNVDDSMQHDIHINKIDTVKTNDENKNLEELYNVNSNLAIPEIKNDNHQDLEVTATALNCFPTDLPADIPLPSDEDIEKEDFEKPSLTDLTNRFMRDTDKTDCDTFGFAAGDITVDLLDAINNLCEEPVIEDLKNFNGIPETEYMSKTLTQKDFSINSTNKLKESTPINNTLEMLSTSCNIVLSDESKPEPSVLPEKNFTFVETETEIKEPMCKNFTKTEDMKVDMQNIDDLIQETNASHHINDNLNAEELKENIDEEIVTSASNSPFVSVNDLNLPKADIDLDQIESPFDTKSKIAISPPISPKLTRKGYNLNFDEIDDPFATKTNIRLSPTPDMNSTRLDENADLSPKKIEIQNKTQQNRRKSQPVRQKRDVTKKKFNSSYSYGTKPNCKEEIKTSIENLTKYENKLHRESKVIRKSCSPPPVSETNNLNTLVTKECEVDELDVTNKTTLVSDETESLEVELDEPLGVNSSTSKENVSHIKDIQNKNVFNLPEIDDMNFNPFATKSKMRKTPSPTFEKDIINDFHKVPIEAFNELIQLEKSSNTTINIEKSIHHDKAETSVLSNETCSSKATDTEFTVREVHTEDEDTAEGPFLEAEDFRDVVKMTDFGTDTDMMQFEDLQTEIENGNKEDGELFIDAEAFEFLLNQNKSNVVADSGKESLFLKFDPLFAKRVSSDGVLAALNRIQKRQSTPKRPAAAVPKNIIDEEKPTTSSNSETLMEGNIDETNATSTKPMMVVNPAINSLVSPRRSTTPPRINRRSLTFTSPAMAVIDRLLSQSGNSSTLDHETTIPRQTREYNETDIALTQLRELLAEKEIHVHNLRCESKELKDRLATMESQVKSLEKKGEERLRRVSDLNDQLTEKTKINKGMAVVVEEYERTIASLIANMEQEKRRNAEERAKLIGERDEQTAHLASMEVSFNDLHSKYEKSKQIILSMKANEDTNKKSIDEFEDNLLKMQNNYELLKQHATSKLNHANQELEKFNRAHESEVLKLNAMIKRKELHITSLEESLAQKTKANEELTAICDELINKVG